MKAKLKDGKLVIEIPVDDIKVGVESVLSCSGDNGRDVKVRSKLAMARYFQRQVLEMGDRGDCSDPMIVRLLDTIAEEAWIDGEGWLKEVNE